MFLEQTEEEKKKQQSDPSQINTTNIGAGGGAEVQPSTLGTTPNTSRLSPVSQTPSKNFGTIQDYFKASKNQGEQFGEQFTNKLGETKTKQQGAIDEASTGALGNIEAGTVGFNQDLISRAVADPTQVAENEDELSSFLNQWNAAYKGPQSFEGSEFYEQAAGAAKTAADKAKLTESTGGRQQLVQDEFGVYGQGNKGLDEALLQQSSYFPKVGEKAKELTSLQDYLKSQSETIADKAQVAKATTEDTRRQAQDAFLGEKGAVKKFQSDIEARTTADREKAAADIKAVQDAISANQDLTDDQLALVGMDRNQFNQLKNQSIRVQETARRLPGAPSPAALPPGAIGTAQYKPPEANFSRLQDYLTFQNPNARITRENTATDADFQRDAALAKLTGRSKFLGADEERGNLAKLDYDQALGSYTSEADDNENVRKVYDAEIAAGKQAEEAAQTAARTAKRKDTQDRILGAIATSGIGAVFPGVGSTIKEGAKRLEKNITAPIKKIFCFTGETPVELANGEARAIKNIKLGEKLRGGGIVQSIRQSMTADGTLYAYKGILVTGYHAVYEGQWKRVKDSMLAGPVEKGGIVYSLVTDNHRILIGDIEFADEHETDDYEILSMDESLAVLNGKILEHVDD